jgi:3-deoxy-7-phosphoheptulonate synthase
VHDIDAGLEYAKRLKKLHEELNDRIYIVMRVYFEKPRTTIGWKGFINDPDLNGTFNISEGLRKARKFLINLAEMKLPVATEMLDPISPQYLADLVSWASIGARTIESQTHREMASGLSMPVGLKNGTDGSLDTAINALKAASSPHNFIGVNPRGQVALVSTNGNPDGHVILRGGKQPNYNLESLSKCEQALESAGLNKSIVVDCSHGNSNNDYTRQPLVALDVVDRIHKGMSSVVGIMLESNLNEGNQSISSRTDDMKYGVSVTDACIDWETTEKLLHRLH